MPLATINDSVSWLVALISVFLVLPEFVFEFFPKCINTVGTNLSCGDIDDAVVRNHGHVTFSDRFENLYRLVAIVEGILHDCCIDGSVYDSLQGFICFIKANYLDITDFPCSMKCCQNDRRIVCKQPDQAINIGRAGASSSRVLAAFREFRHRQQKRPMLQTLVLLRSGRVFEYY